MPSKQSIGSYIFAVGVTLSLVFPRAALAAASFRPNIIVILADDMGFSDPGCYGGEIPTPGLDHLAADGLRFTDFHNDSRCCPSRATILTGLYSHEAGIGLMTAPRMGPNGRPLPGYLGHLNDNCVTIAQMLHSAGYFTAVTDNGMLARRGFTEWCVGPGF